MNKKGVELSSGRTVLYRGVLYPSINAFARAFNKNPAAVHARLGRKWTYGQSVGEETPPISTIRGRRKPTTVKTKSGIKHFSCFKEAAEWCGVDRRVAHSRRRIGWTLEEALEQADPPEQTYNGYGVIYLVKNNKNGMEYVGQTMQRLGKRWRGHLRAALKGGKTRLCVDIRRYGESSFNIKQLEVCKTRADLNRLENKWINKLGTRWPNGYNATKGGSGNVKGVSITYRGKVYASYAQLANSFGVHEETFRRRLIDGWSISDAVKTDGNPLYKKTKINGVVYKSYREAAIAYGISYKKVHRRIKRGWTIRQALGIDYKKPSITKPCEIEVCGVVYKSKRDAAKAYGLEYATLVARLSKGWTIDEAFELSERGKKTDFYNSQRVVVGDKEFSSMSDAARHFKQPLSRVLVRLGLGWDIDKAFKTPKRNT